MGMDFFALFGLITEIGEALKKRPIRACFTAGKYDLYLQLSPTTYLLASCLPGAGRAHLVSNAPKSDRTDWGKGRLKSAMCLSVEQMNGDRALCLRFVKQDSIGGTTRSMLVVEMTGRNSNVILMDEPSGKIMDCLRRITPSMSRYRQLMPGASYRPPPPQNRFDPRHDAPEAFAQALRSDPDKPLVEALSRMLMCADRSTAHRIASESGLVALTPAGDLEASDVEKLYRCARTLYLQIADCRLRIAECETPDSGLQIADRELPGFQSEIRNPKSQIGPSENRNSTGQAFVFSSEDGTLKDFTAFDPIWVPDERKRSFPTLSQAVAYFYEHKRAAETIKQSRASLETSLNRLIASTSKKTERLREELNRARNADEFKRMGELLTAHLYQVRPRQEAITLSDFYDPSQKITIALDPNRSPSENAQRYFAQYRKATRGEQTIQQLHEAAGERLAELKQHAAELSSAQDEHTLESLRNRLIEAGIIRSEAKKGGHIRKEKTPEIHPRRYITKEGWTVFVGRNDWENDLLTRRAHPEDFWFHAQGCPGSHVVLKREGRKAEPGKRTLEEAAGVAAYWSKARTSKTVPVNYTLKKYVRKPRRAKPGSVLIQREKTLFVEPNLLPLADSALKSPTVT